MTVFKKKMMLLKTLKEVRKDINKKLSTSFAKASILINDSRYRTQAEERFKKLNLVFVVGAPHSGTSITFRILSTFEGVCSMKHESYWFENHIAAKQIEKQILNLIKPDDISFLEKTPTHYQHIDRILKIFPNAKIVYCTRNCIDNYISLLKSSPNTPCSSFKSRSAVFNAFKQLLIALERYPNNIYVSSLELLTKEPISSISSLCELIGIKASKSAIGNALNPNSDFERYHTSQHTEKLYAKGEKPLTELYENHDHAYLRDWQLNQGLFKSTVRSMDEVKGRSKHVDVQALMKLQDTLR